MKRLIITFPAAIRIRWDVDLRELRYSTETAFRGSSSNSSKNKGRVDRSFGDYGSWKTVAGINARNIKVRRKRCLYTRLKKAE